jgi:hypothetical protein
VLVHGLQGHPQKTWYNEDDESYWPRDQLVTNFPLARVLVYGYDSKISHFFSGAVNKNSFLDHARNLMLDLTAVRKNHVSPLVVV